MGRVEFLNKINPERFNILITTRDPYYVYLLLRKHLGEDIETLSSKYLIRIDAIRKRIFFEGKEPDICKLVLYLSSFGVQFESVTQISIRVDIGMFLSKIK